MKKCKHLICLILALSLMFSIIPVASAASTFSDVPDGKWYSENVAYVYENGLMNGVGDGKFDPGGTLTRGMLVTVLYRMEGEPMTPDTSFTDVAANKYYYSAVAWAENKGIVNGKTETTFEPNTPINRQEVAAILMRYTENFGYGGGEQADLTQFKDYGSISNFAKKAMSWAVATGLLNGSNGNLDPKGFATRAQIAAILNRFCDNILGNSENNDEYAKAMEGYAKVALAFGKEHGISSRFGLIYIDSDNIPELVCTPEAHRLTQVTVYTWYNGEVRNLGEYGMYATLPYAPYENAFGDYSKPMCIAKGQACQTNFDTSKFIEYDYSQMTTITNGKVNQIILGK